MTICRRCWRIALLVLGVGLSTGAVRTATLVTRTQSNASMAVQVVPEGTALAFDASADGRAVILATHSFVGGGTSDNPARLILRDLVAGTTSILSPGGPYGPPTRPAGAFSPDATRIAYAWTENFGANMAQVRSNLSLIGTRSDATPRTLAGQGAVPHGWSPDGKSILFLQHGPGASISDPTSINWLDVVSGSVRPIKVLEPFRGGADVATYPRLSPDGTSIAYSAIARDGSSDRHVFVIDSDGRNERAVATLGGANGQAVWAPDSAHLVFVNARSEGRDLYAVSVRRNGQPVSPVRIRAGFTGELLRISKSGDLFFVEYVPNRYQMIAERRPGDARVVRVFPGLGGTWSKGNQLAFLRFNHQGFFELVIRSDGAGDDRSYQHAAIGAMPPRWLSDESGVIVLINANGDGGRPGGSFYRVDARSGEFRRLFSKDTTEEVRSFVGVLSPDDTTFYLVARARSEALWTRIVALDVATGAKRAVVTFPGSGMTTPPALAVTSDGTTLAIGADDGAISTVRTDGSDYRDIKGPFPTFDNPYGRSATGSPAVLQWTPDGRSILFAASESGSPASWRLMKVAANGGPIEFDGLDTSRIDSAVSLPREGVGRLRSIDVNADGSRIAFSSRADQTYIVWKLPNVVSGLTRK